MSITLTTAGSKITIPKDWTLEPYSEHGYEEYVVLQTPEPNRYAATLCLDEKREHRRGFRTGFTTIGSLQIDKRYWGRGWRQQIVDEAVAHLQGLLA